jgi:predicted dehydrogenase
MLCSSIVTKAAKPSVAVVGLGFGSAFVPIYQAHPNVSGVAICETNAELLQSVGDRFGVERRYADLESLLADPEIDAVHLLTPVPLHFEQTLAVLDAGKHCACAVPMATSLEDLTRIVDKVRSTGLRYMMMETAVYTREYLYAQDLVESGKLGEITFLRGVYHQDLEADYPRYWWAQPPMHYATHAIAPVLALAKTRAVRVCCLGSGTLHPHIQQPNGTRYPLQTGIFRLEGTTAAAEVTKSWFQTARQYVEAFSIFGDRLGFEWQQLEDEDPVVYEMLPPNMNVRWRDVTGKRVEVPFRPDLLPAALAPFAEGGHGGSHPHLVHEFISSIVEGRPSAIDERTSANWCAPGICANESSLLEGEPVEIPGY